MSAAPSIAPSYARIVQRRADPAVVAHLVAVGFDPTLAHVVAARGVTDATQMSDDLRQLLPPSGMLGMDEATELLVDVIAAEAAICVIADYDCDGATSCTVAVEGLRRLGANVDFLVPNRFETGYGLTPEVVDLAVKHPRLGRPDLLITVDNGIASIDGVARAHELGLEVLVTDHHLPGERTPEAAAIVNPNQRGCSFGSKHLAGVGVVFYLLMALRARMRDDGLFTAQNQPRLDDLLDLVALGTVADVVKLDQNNRILVSQGLKRMRSGRARPGIEALFMAAGRQPAKASSFDLGFGLGPRINAAGRLADMSIGISCLLSEDAGGAATIAAQLDQLNRDRRELEQETRDAALASLPATDAAGRNTLVLFDESWHQGVVGLVASRVKDQHHRPTIVFAPDKDGLIKGSGRSIAGLHLRDCLDLVTKLKPQVIEKFGGHAMAAGLTIRQAALQDFTAAFEQAARQMMDPADLDRTLETDGSLDLRAAHLQTAQLLDGQVWGQGFAAPVFLDEFRCTGQRVLKERHLKLHLSRGNQNFEAIWFNHAQPLPDRVALAYRLGVNEYMGASKLQLMIEAQA